VATHLKAKRGFEEKREAQGKILLEKLSEFNSEHIPVIVGGDFNDEPMSLVYKVFGKSFSSAYLEYPDAKVEPYTTYKKRKTVEERCIDYLWYTSKDFKVVGLLEIPDPKTLIHYLPCESYPSDHLSIMAKFTFKQ
jgi:endonuclease/exonuclease/phosphatase family metal-dependent hydrolase